MRLREKSIDSTLDENTLLIHKYFRPRTGQDNNKSHKKSNISHIWSQAPRKDIAMKFGIGVDVHDIVAWAEFDFLNLRGVNFTGGYNLGFSIDYVYRP